jgi:predicted metalloprotease with PDZ domain
MSFARSIALTTIGFALLNGCGGAQSTSPIQYDISFENRAHHEAEITVHYADLPAGVLQLRMSRSSPGRYALHEFAKNVYDFRAVGAGGREVEVTRPNPHQWNVDGHGGEVTVTYTLYGDHADGTYAGIDRTHAHLNMPATFLWAIDLEDRAIELSVEIPEGSNWEVATQLAPMRDPFRFTAPNLYYFLDSPTEVSDFWLKEWDVDGQTVRVALHHAGTDAEAERYAEAAAAIVDASRDIYGELPAFDFGTYTFLACYLPWVDGDGMEHRNSTVLTSTGSLAANMTGVLGTVAHEFFHAWNVERIRPATLEPFDFTRANMSRELWFAEGFTSYFDDLILWRGGLISQEAFGQRMGGIANAVTNARGRSYFSPIEMSMQAPFVDAATSVDPNNRQNTFLSYYTWGSGIGLALDLELRTRFEGVTADHLMREMWAAHGVNEVPYVVDDIEAALARVSGDADFAADFFDRYVRGREGPDYSELLTRAGIEVGPARGAAAWIGPIQMRFGEGGATVLATPREGSPLYEAGIDRTDVITSINGRVPVDRDTLDAMLAALSPGSAVTFQVQSRGETFTVTVEAATDPGFAGRWTPDGLVTPEQAAFRAAWFAPTPG